MVGGGFFAYGISAIQTTVLSLHIAHNCSKEYLAVFSFLLSCLYFSIQLLRRNIIEPFYQSSSTSINKTYIIQITLILSFMLIVVGITSYISKLFELSLFLLFLTLSTLLWEIRKAELRKAKLFLNYSLMETLILIVLSSIIAGNVFGFGLGPDATIVLQAFMQMIAYVFSKVRTHIAKDLSETYKSAPSIQTFSFGEYLFVLSIIVINLWLIKAGYASEVGEIRAIFLLLTVGTFCIGALRNSLATKMTFSLFDYLLVGAILLNIFIVNCLPTSFVQNVIPSVSANFHYVLIPVSLDVIGSLLVAIFSMQLIYHNKMNVASESRLISVLVLAISFAILGEKQLDAFTIACTFGLSSIGGATYLHFRKRMICP